MVTIGKVLAGPPVALNELYVFHFYMMEFLCQSYICLLHVSSYGRACVIPSDCLPQVPSVPQHAQECGQT